MAWETLSFVLKILASLSLVVGLALPLMEVAGWRLTGMPKSRLIGTTALLLGSALVLAGTERLVDARKEEERQARAHDRLAAEILSNARALDTRLALMHEAMVPSAWDAEVTKTRERVAPALSHLGAGYTKLMAEQRLSGLQAQWAGTPLHVDRAANLVALFNELEMESEPVVAYYQALSDVVVESDGFLRALRRAVDRPAELEEELDLRARGVEIKSKWAHLHGFKLALGMPPEQRERLDAALTELRNLSPRGVPSAGEIDAKMRAAAGRYAEYVEQKARLVAKGEARLQMAMAEYASLMQALEISPDDSWNVVVGKAISLRQLGHPDQAARVFEIYGELFAANDAGAAAYSATAVTFTQSMDELGLAKDGRGGVYIYELDPAGAGQKAGLMEGDIIIAIDDRRVGGVLEYEDAIQSKATHPERTVTFVRIVDGRAVKPTARFRGNRLQASIMPI